MDENNIQRVDKRPASVFSIVIFALVFTAVYVFYPQISMIIPFAGEKVTVETSFVSQKATLSFYEANYVVMATVTDIGKPKLHGSDVYSNVTLSVSEVFKGDIEGEIIVPNFGGTLLMTNGTNTNKKYIVTYENAAELEKGKTYVLALNENLEVINGKYGLLEKNGSEDSFTDETGATYSELELSLAVALH